MFNQRGFFHQQNKNLAYATGGEITTYGLYRIHTFTSSGTLVVVNSGHMEVLWVGGGGGSGDLYGNVGLACCAGGGAGGLCYQGSRFMSVGSKSVTIGLGGSGRTNGGDTIFDGVTAKGGGAGGGGQNVNIGVNGGSGGGGSAYTSGYGSYGLSNQASFPGVSVYGNTGSWGTSTFSGGGGGAGSPATFNAGVNRGSGLALNISGSLITYASGGNGCGMGGSGVQFKTANTGDGADGSGLDRQIMYGGSGILVVRYLLQ